MAKQATRSDLIAQPSLWPELEPAPPAPPLPQPRAAKGPARPGNPEPAADTPGLLAAEEPLHHREGEADPSGLDPLEPPRLGPAAGAESAAGLVASRGGSEPATPSPGAASSPGAALPPGASTADLVLPAAAEPLPTFATALDRPATADGSPPLAAMPEPMAPAAVHLPRFRTTAPGPPLPERLLILDTETTGLQSGRDQCIEIGAVLFHVAERAVLDQVSFLLPCQENPAEPINGIRAAVTRTPQPWQAGLRFFEAMLEAADLVVAHNVKFDRAWFGRDPLPAIAKPWLCSMEDIRWPASLRLKSTPSVRDLALAHGVPVWAAHRALTDCIYISQVFERCGELESLLLEGLEPRQLYRARLSYAERHRAREAGFRWNEPLRGAWSRRLSQREVSLLPFQVDLAEADLAQVL